MRKVTRRSLVRGVGASWLAAPFLSTLSARPARAAGTAKRIFFWFSPNGTVHKHWRPSGSAGAFNAPAGGILEPLSVHKDKLLVLDGLNFEGARGGSHEGGMEHMLTGGGAISVDQFIAQQIGEATPFASIELGVHTSAWGASVQTRMSYDSAHKFVHPEDNPANAFKRLFGGVTAAPAELDEAARKRQSVLDVAKAELADLQKALGTEQKQKLDAHLDSIRRIEKRIAAGAKPGGNSGGMSGGACGPATAPSLTDVRGNATFPDVGTIQTDLLVQAAACNLSRVLSLQWSHTVSPTIFSWAQASEGHHELSHKDDGNAAGVAAFVKAERWMAEQFAAFLTKLDETPDPEGGGTLLDTSTVVWVKELGDSRLHDFKSVPFVIAGGGNGFFNPGRYLKFDGQAHQKLLVTLCNSMAIDVDAFGIKEIKGGLAGVAA